MERELAANRSRTSFGLSRLLQDTIDLDNGSSGSILQRLLNAARLHLGMDVAFISEFVGGHRIFRYVDQPEDLSALRVGESRPLDRTFCGKIVTGTLPRLIRNAREEAGTPGTAAPGELDIGAHLGVPIRLSDGSIFGTFCVFSFHAEHTLNERDLALVQVFADIAAGILEEEVRRSRDESRIRRRISRLLDGDAFSMVWQPIVNVPSHRVVGVESLARFPGDDGRSPADWFDEAAMVGLGNELESKAVEKAAMGLEHLPPNVYVSFNASAGAFLKDEVVKMLLQLPLQRLVLEITEHDVIEDYELLSATLAPLRAKGLRLAVDDAGAGYASFRHVLRLRPEIIKLDMSLTRDIDSDVTRRSLAASLVQFSHDIESSLVAEGVETPGELETLESLGVHTVQGFYLHRPQPLDKLSAMLASG